MRIRSLNSIVALALGVAAFTPSMSADVGGAQAGTAPAPDVSPWVVSESEGRVLARGEGTVARSRGRLSKGAELAWGETVLSGPGARLELRGADGARWRLGQHVIWQSRQDGARLLAGSALAVVPDGAVLQLGTARAATELGAGVWLVTAVENGGLKITALENGRVALSRSSPPTKGAPTTGDAAKAVVDEKGDELKLAAGEVVFAPPDGAAFGPIVTIYLEELMVTSRLISGFSEPLPQARRMLALAEAQRERIGAMTEAFVGGARAADGFEVVASKRRGPAPAQVGASAKPAPAK